MSLKHVIERKPFLESAVAKYEQTLDSGAAYLVARGVTKEAAKRHRLGVCSNPPPEHAAMRGMLAVPYLTVSGPIAVKFRCIQPGCDCKAEGHPKYLCEPDLPPLLYNATDLLREDDTLYVVEGELDAVIVSAVLGLACVGFPGSGNWRDSFGRAITTDWERILVVADGDQAGRNAAKDVAKHLRGRVIRLSDGDDATSFYLREGRDAILAKLEAN